MGRDDLAQFETLDFESAYLKIDRNVPSRDEMTAHSITVYIACPHCELVYRTKQARVSITVAGQFDCVDCRKPVQSWSGFYDCFYWQPVTRNT
jgi:hypothetical protein